MILWKVKIFQRKKRFTLHIVIVAFGDKQPWIQTDPYNEGGSTHFSSVKTFKVQQLLRTYKRNQHLPNKPLQTKTILFPNYNNIIISYRQQNHYFQFTTISHIVNKIIISDINDWFQSLEGVAVVAKEVNSFEPTCLEELLRLEIQSAETLINSFGLNCIAQDLRRLNEVVGTSINEEKNCRITTKQMQNYGLKKIAGKLQ